MLSWFAGIIPEPWKCYTVPPGLTVLQWVTDFSKRIEQLQQVSALADKGGIKALRVSGLILSVLIHNEDILCTVLTIV